MPAHMLATIRERSENVLSVAADCLVTETMASKQVKSWHIASSSWIDQSRAVAGELCFPVVLSHALKLLLLFEKSYAEDSWAKIYMNIRILFHVFFISTTGRTSSRKVA